MSVLHSVVHEVASAEGVAPTELPPLYDVVDAEVVEQVFEAPLETSAPVEFIYAGYIVTVTAAEEVSVERHDA